MSHLRELQSLITALTLVQEPEAPPVAQHGPDSGASSGATAADEQPLHGPAPPASTPPLALQRLPPSLAKGRGASVELSPEQLLPTGAPGAAVPTIRDEALVDGVAARVAAAAARVSVLKRPCTCRHGCKASAMAIGLEQAGPCTILAQRHLSKYVCVCRRSLSETHIPTSKHPLCQVKFNDAAEEAGKLQAYLQEAQLEAAAAEADALAQADAGNCQGRTGQGMRAEGHPLKDISLYMTMYLTSIRAEYQAGSTPPYATLSTQNSPRDGAAAGCPPSPPA
jgi:hypothetical protein